MELKNIIKIFNEKNNGRIYPEDVFIKAYEDLVIRLRVESRINKIKRIIIPVCFWNHLSSVWFSINKIIEMNKF